MSQSRVYKLTEKEREKHRRWYWSHRDQVRVKNREWHAANPGKAMAYYEAVKKNNPKKMMLGWARQRAKRNGWTFDLDISDIIIPDHCPVFGTKLDWWGDKNNTPSLDRLIPEKFYVKGNVRVISWRANRLKSDATLEELKALVTYQEINEI